MLNARADVRTAVVSDGAVILDVTNDSLTTLNTTGAYVWERLRAGDDVDAIVSSLALETNTDAETVAKDVRDFLAQLAMQHLTRGEPVRESLAQSVTG